MLDFTIKLGYFFVRCVYKNIIVIKCSVIIPLSDQALQSKKSKKNQILMKTYISLTEHYLMENHALKIK